jgi:hypothetical protein
MMCEIAVWAARIAGAAIIAPVVRAGLKRVGFSPDEWASRLMAPFIGEHSATVAFWGVLTLIGLALLLIEWWLPQLLERVFPALTERWRSLTPLSEAAHLVYERTRDVGLMKVVEGSEKGPKDTINWIRRSLCQRADVYGRLHPHRRFIRVRYSQTNPLALSADGTDIGQVRGTPRSTYVDLAVPRREIRRLIQHIMKMDKA